MDLTKEEFDQVLAGLATKQDLQSRATGLELKQVQEQGERAASVFIARRPV